MSDFLMSVVRADLADRLRSLRTGNYCCLRDALTGWTLLAGVPGGVDDAVALGDVTAADQRICRADLCTRAACRNGSLASRRTLPVIDPDTGRKQTGDGQCQ